jgi:hypothetical protein
MVYGRDDRCVAIEAVRRRVGPEQQLGVARNLPRRPADQRRGVFVNFE